MAKQDEDLLDEFGVDLDELDLLGSVIEDDAEGWVPEKAGEGIQGLVLKVGQTKSTYTDEMCPTVTVELKGGNKVRVIGYGTVLRRELIDGDPQPGDLIAVKYFGVKKLKTGKFAGKDYKHFGVLVRKGGGVKK